MKVDTTRLDQLQRVLVEAYRSPSDERSIVKGVPLEELEEFRTILRTLGGGFRIRYRGPRYDHQRLTTLKRDASSFSVYKI